MLKRTELEKTAKILGGLLIWRSSERGDAARAGVRQGDILLAANGFATPDVTSFVRARSLREDGVTLDLFRFGQRLRVEVKFSLVADELHSTYPRSEPRSSASMAAWVRPRATRLASN